MFALVEAVLVESPHVLQAQVGGGKCSADLSVQILLISPKVLDR